MLAGATTPSTAQLFHLNGAMRCAYCALRPYTRATHSVVSSSAKADDPYVDGPRPARGGAARGSDRLRSYVRPVDAVAHDRCQDGFRDMSSKQYGGFEDCHWIVRSVSCLGSIDRTICSVSSKPRLQREAMVALTPNSLSCSQYSYPALSGWAMGARGVARLH